MSIIFFFLPRPTILSDIDRARALVRLRGVGCHMRHDFIEEMKRTLGPEAIGYAEREDMCIWRNMIGKNSRRVQR